MIWVSVLVNKEDHDTVMRLLKNRGLVNIHETSTIHAYEIVGQVEENKLHDFEEIEGIIIIPDWTLGIDADEV